MFVEVNSFNKQFQEEVMSTFHETHLCRVTCRNYTYMTTLTEDIAIYSVQQQEKA
jgi:hypothetical protein